MNVRLKLSKSKHTGARVYVYVVWTESWCIFIYLKNYALIHISYIYIVYFKVFSIGYITVTSTGFSVFKTFLERSFGTALSSLSESCFTSSTFEKRCTSRYFSLLERGKIVVGHVCWMRRLRYHHDVLFFCLTYFSKDVHPGALSG